MKNLPTKILIVDDEPDIIEILKYNLNNEGYNVKSANNGKKAVEKAKKFIPDIILLDVMMPEMDGIEACVELKKISTLSNTRIIFLSARGEDFTQIAAFDAGADDYITKPFSPKELIARIQSLLRRANTEVADKVIKAGNIILDPNNHKVTVDGRNVSLGPKEFKLLKFFLTHQNKVFSRNQLLDSIWGQNTYVEERTVDVHILRLRKSIKSESTNYIQTIRGAGYIFSA